MKKTISTIVAAAVLATPAVAGAKTIGSESARGDYATALASGEANRPRWIKVTVTTSPRQSADGNWNMVCSKGMGAGTKSGTIRGSGKFTRRLKMPMRSPDSCTVSALGSLSGGGSIRVTLTAG